MIVYKCNCIPWAEREDRIVEYLPQVILRPRFADIMEVVVERDIEKGDLYQWFE